MEEVPTEIVLDDRLELGEGPTFDPLTGTALWFDILGKALFEMPGDGGAITRHDLPFMASEIVAVDERTQLLASEKGLFLRDRVSGALTFHHDIEAENAATRSNDGGVHPAGALWIGTMGKHAETEAGGIYWYRAGETRKIVSNLSIPNTICFSSDGLIGYFADTKVNKLMRIACDPETGLPTGAPETLHDHHSGLGALDGAVIASDNTIWVACWGGRCVTVFSPEGEIVRQIRVPARQPSCPAFIGGALDRLLVTTAQEGMDAEARAADDGAGKTFVLEVGTTGRAPPRVVIG